MKKSLFALLFCLSIFNTVAQIPSTYLPDYYKNLEKYWYYRYRLVNDFLKIGGSCGESMPASKRNRKYPRGTTPTNNGFLEWGDATQALGHYIGTLATEYKLLQLYGWDTKENKNELYYALNAFDRLDWNSEEYMRNLLGTYPCNSSGRQPGDLNGFFVRDDVTQDLVNNNFDHFNRPGIAATDAIIENETKSDYFTSHDKLTSGNWTDPAPPYPTEESQDQIAEMFVGLALISKQVDNSANLFGEYLRCKAANSLFRMISWIPQSRFTSWTPVQLANNAEYSMVAATVSPPSPYPWTILNPLTKNCIYGTAGDKYNYGSQCSDAGALFYFSALPAAIAAGICANACGNNSTWIESTAASYENLFQLLQRVTLKTQKDISFVDDFAAYSRNWEIRLPSPPRPLLYPPNWSWPKFPAFKNTTWDVILKHSTSLDFYAPHTPLIYRLDTYGPGCGVGYNPKDYDNQYPSYTGLLNSAPPCGPHNYCGEYGNKTEWSGVNRLLEPLKRYGESNYQVTTDNPCGYNASFNGLDYMLLFNLYGLVETSGYLKKMINPFYTENFNTNYPDGSNLGSSAYKLTLNYLEFISMINKINTTGHLTIRCAKAIELNPGFEAKTGSFFDTHIEDYSCNNLYTDGTSTEPTPFHYAILQTNQPNFPTPYPTPIEYSPDNTNHNDLRQLYVNDSADRLANKYYNPEQEQAYFNELKKSVYQSGDPAQINLMEQMFSELNIGSAEGDFALISPNPSKGLFEISFAHTGYYTIQIADLRGKVFYKTQTDHVNKQKIDLGNIAAGNYIIKIVSSTSAYTKKLTITK